jgi:hypothetical protein
MPAMPRRFRAWGVAALVVAISLAGVAWGWCQLSLREIDERQALILELEHRFDAFGTPTTFPARYAPIWGNRLRLMWLLGAGRASDLNVGLIARDDEAALRQNAEYLERAHRLFPEATIHAGWHPRGGPANTP